MKALRILAVLGMVGLTAGSVLASTQYVSDWEVVVTENGVPRRLTQIDPQDIAYHFSVDQAQAPGWYCTVKPEVDFEGVRTRFLTCDYKGKTQAAIRTTCSTTTGRRAQEVWLGENFKVAVRLECLSGALP